MHAVFISLRILDRRSWALLLVALTAITARAAADSRRGWPQFRGPDGNAVALEGGPPPTHFGPTTNLLWKAVVPPGHSSPCIFGSKIFLTGFESNRFVTVALDRKTGEKVWRAELPPTKAESTHRIASPASSTPCTDGTTLFSYFGSFGIVAYDFDGHQRWQRVLPPPMVEFGTGTSPILYRDLLILVSDGDQGSYMLAVDKRNGRDVWRVDRPEFRRSFATPYIWSHDDQDELVVPGSIWLRSYDPRNGRELWSFTGTSRVANSTPAAGDGLLYSASWNIGGDPGDRITMEPFEEFARVHDANKDGRMNREEIPAGPLRDRFSQMDINKDGTVTAEEWNIMREMFAKAGNAVLAIRPGGHGDITTSHLAWKSTRSLPYVASPVYYEGRLFTVKNGGLASCYEAKTGRVIYQDERMDAAGDYYASLIAGGGKVIAISQKGQATVLSASGNQLEILARNELGSEVMATPALVDGTLYVRSAAGLFAFGTP